MATLKTAGEIRGVMDALNLDVIAIYFDKDDEEIDPYVVCEGVSVDAFNEYVGDGEDLRIALRFLALYDGRIVIVDLPNGVHESTAEEFKSECLAASGNGREVAKRGSITVTRAANPKNEVDATFGPMGSTPHRTPAPAPRTIADWVTLAVEVGRSQSWASLRIAARWWCGYAGIQTTCPIPKLRPKASGTIQNDAAEAAANVTFDMRRILSIPANEALPTGVNTTATVDLRTVMNLVIDSL